MVYQEIHIVFEGQLGLWKFEEYIHAFPLQFLFHDDAEIDMVNGPAPGAFGIAGNRIVRIHAVAHEGGGVVRGDVIDDGDFVEKGSPFDKGQIFPASFTVELSFVARDILDSPIHVQGRLSAPEGHRFETR